MESLRGSEGIGAKAYFDVFDEMILQNKADFFFRERNRRPPLDNVNAMLSFAYSLLANDCAAALEAVGLDAYVGFLHRDRPGRTSLALDLMAELREEVRTSAAQMHDLYRRGYTPRVKPTKACNACSLRELCLPRLQKSGSVQVYLQRSMEETP